ncbi:FecR domain-containing protein [Lacinutrix neustonica]|uniref:FecR domain-containing protein n=1 Tax=Lacinutrix neustonica TaxID=2980107 RepID=A0A9E8MVP9_9FLAO|nr:FecR domain-containing protein [Lacinutrix neustonica]WAC02363.1 FecR domain-containing protein [Lacinutrix neustonica]
MSKTNKTFIEKLLNDDSFINWAKETNTNDIAFWSAWINKHPEHIDAVYTAKAMLLGVVFNEKKLDKTKINMELTTVLNRINTGQKQSNSHSKQYKLSAHIKYAAVALITLFISIFSIATIYNSKTITHQTSFGEIIDLKLPDGTSVVLNGNSSIKYNKDQPRTVFLEGEAYFKVKPMPSTQAKFWVNTQDLTVEVFGTQFNVNTRQDKTSVLLDEGSIHLLLKNGDSKIMNPGEIASYSKEEQKVSHKKITKKTSYASWKEGTYIFNNITLDDVMQHIENTYGMSYEFVDKSLKTKLVSGGIPNENLDICLLAIQKSTEVKILTKEDKLYIYKLEIN